MAILGVVLTGHEAKKTNYCIKLITYLQITPPQAPSRKGWRPLKKDHRPCFFEPIARALSLARGQPKPARHRPPNPDTNAAKKRAACPHSPSLPMI